MKKASRKKRGKVKFRAWITLPNGKRLYASQVGIKAFPIPMKEEKEEEKEEEKID